MPPEAPIRHGRDPRLERDFLDHSAHLAGLGANGFQDAVVARLDAVPGDDFLRLSLERFAHEIGEEGADVAGWAAGAMQSDDFNRRDHDQREAIMRWLVHLAGLGAQVEYAVRRLRDEIDG